MLILMTKIPMAKLSLYIQDLQTDVGLWRMYWAQIIQPFNGAYNTPFHRTHLDQLIFSSWRNFIWIYIYIFQHNGIYKFISISHCYSKKRAVSDRLKNKIAVSNGTVRPTRKSLLPLRPSWTDNILIFFFWVACKFTATG